MKESKRENKIDKLKEKSTKEEPSRSYDKTKTKKPLKCWICEEPHTMKNYPSILKVAVITQSNVKKKKEETSVRVMQILGAAVAMEAIS